MSNIAFENTDAVPEISIKKMSLNSFAKIHKKALVSGSPF